MRLDNQVVITKSERGIVTLTLNRPEAANAFSLQLLQEFSDILNEIQFDRSVRCVIITGAGEKVFCAGADLKERAGMDHVQVQKTLALIRSTVNNVEALPQPVIAAMNGMAFGGGLELVLACDLRVCSEQAKVGLTETSLGIIPGAGGTQRLPRLIGKGRAKELIFTAKRVSAQEAEKIGLIEYVVPQNQVLSKAFEIAEQIVQNAPIAVAQAKQAIDKGYDLDLYTGLSIEQSAYNKTIPTCDRLEGLRAFKEKRAPIFEGK